MDLVRRIAVRHALRTADAVDDPEGALKEIERLDLVRKFEGFVTTFAELEPLVPKMREAEAVMQQPDHPQQATMMRFWSDNRYKFLFKVTHGYKTLRNIAGYDLFLAFLQQYDLPPALRKKVEAADKFYSRASIQKPPRGKEVEVYLKYLTAYRDHLELAKAVLSQGQPRGQGGTDVGAKTKQAGPFTVVNTGGFSDETVEEAAKVVAHAAGLLQKKGLSRVCYGEILLSNTLSRASVLAFYLKEKDEMFVRANLKGKQHDAVRTVIHELGHRLHFKFLKSKDRDIRAIYYKLGTKEQDRKRELINEPSLRPQPGETLVSKGKTYEVQRVDYDKVHLILKDQPERKATMPLVAWIEMKGLDWAKPSTFVTPYAAKNHEENFAEMIAAWCADRLPAEQVTMLEAVLG